MRTSVPAKAAQARRDVCEGLAQDHSTSLVKMREISRLSDIAPAPLFAQLIALDRGTHLAEVHNRRLLQANELGDRLHSSLRLLHEVLVSQVEERDAVAAEIVGPSRLRVDKAQELGVDQLKVVHRLAPRLGSGGPLLRLHGPDMRDRLAQDVEPDKMDEGQPRQSFHPARVANSIKVPCEDLQPVDAVWSRA